MTDRELLELAAKAAGHRLHPKVRSDVVFLVLDNADWAYLWNPLTDDGDALRLAVYLKFGVTVDDPDISVTSQYGKVVYQQSGPDPYAATRRAIVLAAASIGKAMT